MGNTLGGKKTTKIMKINGETFKLKTPIQAGEVTKDYPGFVLLESEAVKHFGIRAKPLGVHQELKAKRLYFLVELPKFPQENAPRKVRSGIIMSAKDRLDSLMLARRSVSDLSLLQPKSSITEEEGPEGSSENGSKTRIKMRLPKADVEKLMRESKNEAEAAEKIMQLYLSINSNDDKVCEQSSSVAQPQVHWTEGGRRIRTGGLMAREASLYPLRSQSYRYIYNLSSFNLTHCRPSATLMASETLANPTNGSVVTSPTPQRTYQVVVAATQKMGIGKDGSLPWKLPSDLKFFKDVTMTTSDPLKRNAVIMGRKTWESIPLQHRPLPGRLNVVLTRSGSFDIATAENVVICGSMLSALELLAESPYCVSIEKVFIIGGGQIYRESLNAPGCDAVHITEIEEHIECDTFIPPLDESVFQPWYSSFPVVENNIRYCFTTYVRVRSSGVELTSEANGQLSDGNLNSDKFEIQRFSFLPKPVFEKHEEYLYLRLVENIISNGVEKNDRTRTGTVSIFGCQMRFNLRKSFPLLTTKKVFWRGVVEELLWFISGSTNAKVLKEKGINIWEGNGSRDYLDSIGLAHREEGDLGPIYGFQWRHFGASYTDMHADYTGQGFDQLLDVISKIKNNPDDRRIILSAWNPSDLKLMALPPCHMFAQFYVANGELSCQMYQRSADMGLGVPFNIASYALLTCMIAHVCDLVPGDFVHTIGDAHVYCNHIRPLQDQLQKLPKPFPVLKINSEKRDIDSFEAADFKLIGYDPHQKIAMKMAV